MSDLSVNAARPGLIPILQAGVMRSRHEGKRLYWIDVDDLAALLDELDRLRSLLNIREQQQEAGKHEI